MTSKEALKSLENMLKDLPYAINYKKQHDIIMQDLDRLELLEKVNKSLIETKESVDKVLEDLGKINEENTRLKKAIEILKGRICVHNQYICYDAYADIRLKDNEIELLKEVLGYESCNI